MNETGPGLPRPAAILSAAAKQPHHDSAAARRTVARLSDQAWWTVADQAELDALTWELVRAAVAHRERCLHCSAGGPWCPDLRDAFAAVDEFRRGRILLSRAEHLRALRDQLEAVAA